MIRIQTILSAEDLCQYRIVKPIRRMLRKKNFHLHISNQMILKLDEFRSQLGLQDEDVFFRNIQDLNPKLISVDFIYPDLKPNEFIYLTQLS